MNTTSNRPSINFWIISSLALVWNLMGVFAYLGQTFMSQKILLTLPKPEQHYFSNIPAWVTAAFATAVFAGVFGSIGLIFKKKVANFLFSISIISMLTHQFYNFFIQDYIAISGKELALPLSTTLIGFFLLWYSYKMSKKGLLNYSFFDSSLCVFLVPAYISYFENRASNFALNNLIFLEGLSPTCFRASKFDEIIHA